MKKSLFIFMLSSICCLSYSQTIYNEALNLKPQKTRAASNPNVVYIDANKTFDLPADGAFLYSSLESESGIVASGYSNNEDYTITIKNQYHRKIILRSSYFLCGDMNDVLSIYDGKDTSARLIRTVSGILDQNFLLFSSGEYLTLRFKSDNSGTAKGYRFRLDNGSGINAKEASPPLPSPMACASTPAADECLNAPLICDLNGYCGNTSGAYTAGNTSGLGNFCGSIENNSWLSFVASGTSSSLVFNSAGCQDNSSGIQAVIYASSNCSSFTEVSNCESQGSGSGTFTITTNVNLVPGQTYYVMVDGFAGNICSYTVTAQSGVALGQQITGPSQVCPGYSATLGSSSTASSYSWTSTPPGVYPNTQTITVSPTVTTTYTLTLGASACAPAGTTVVKTVTVTNTLNPANITAPNPICMGSNITLSSLTQGGTYSWSGPAGASASTQTLGVNNWSTANNGIYTLTINYGPGCATAPATINLSGTPTPTVNISAAPSLTVCAGQSLTLTASGGTGSNPSYVWSWPLGQSITLQQCISVPFVGLQCTNFPGLIPGVGSWGPKAVLTPNQSGQYCVSYENAAGCIGNKCVNVVVQPAAPAMTVTPSAATVCPGQSTTLTVSGGSTYTWSPAASLSSANSATVTATPTITTIYTVSTSACGGSTSTQTVQITVNGTPPSIGTISGTTSICPNATGITYSVNNIASTNYTWSVPAGASITSTPTNSNAITVNFGASAGTVSVTAAGTCGTATAAITVTLNPALNLTITPSNQSICPGTSATLTASGATSYTWSPAGSLSSSSGSVVIANPTVTTVYNVTGANGGCTGTSSATVTIGGGLTLTVSPASSTVCAGGSVTLTASGATNYTWSPASTLNSANGASVIATPTAVTNYTVLGATGTCTGSATANVSIGPGLTLTVTANTPTVCPGASALLSASGATSYTWFPSSTLSSPTGTGVTASPTVNTTYTVVGSTGSCLGASTINIGIGSCVSTACNLTAIRTAMTNAGCVELLGMNNTCSLYFLNPQFMTGPQAQSFAQTLGANLISVQSASENSDLVTALANQGYSSNVIWIGFSDAVTEGTFTWFDGAPVTYTNWAPTEPNNAGDEDCVQIYADGSWNDLACSGYNSMSVIEVNICPQMSVTSVPIHCPNTAVTLTASTIFGSPSYTYTWIQAGTETFTNTSTPGNTDVITVTSTAANTFTVYSEDRYSCPQSATVSLSVYSTPTITVNNSTICLGQQTATLTAGGAINYSWTPSATLSSGTGNQVTANPATTTSYVVTGEDANTCTSTNTAVVTVVNIPTITVSSNATVCPGASATLTAGGATNYTWSPGAMTGSNTTVSPVSTTVYTVTGENSNGCIATNTVEVFVSGTPTISTSGDATVCPGASTTLTSNGAVSYTWNPSSSLSSGTGSNVVSSPTLTTTYTITGENSNGCISTNSLTVTVSSTPTITISPDATICPAGSTSLTANGAINYTWSPSAGLSSSNGSSVTAGPANTTTYTVTGDNINGCISTASMVVTVAANPTLTASANVTVCPLAATTLSVSGANTYTWSPNIFLNNNTSASVISTPSVTTTYTIDGASTDGCIGSATLNVAVANTVVVNVSASNATICPLGSSTLSATGATSYTWTPAITLSSATGASVVASPPASETYTVIGSTSTCTNSAQVVITVTTNPVIIPATSPTICSGATTPLSVSGASSYTWAPDASLNTTSGANVNANPGVSTTYSVAGTSPLGCIGYTVIPVVVIPTPTITTLASSLTICEGNTTLLTAYGSATNSYTWSPAGSLSAAQGVQVTASPIVSTVYSVIGSNGTAPDLCTASNTIEIVVIPKTPANTYTVDPICFGSYTTLFADGGNTYSWNPPFSVASPNSSITVAYPQSTTVYTVTVSNSGVCPNTATVEVIVHPLPLIDAGQDTTINMDEYITLHGTGDVEVGFYPTNGNELNCNFCPSIIVHPQEYTCYILKGTNQYGCVNTDTVCVDITQNWEVFFPNAFTPDGNGNNDIFIPVGYAIKEIKLTIFDRWGVQIFQSDDTHVGWDGTYKGKLCEQGVYIYKAEVTSLADTKVYKTGHVTLLSRVK